MSELLWRQLVKLFTHTEWFSAVTGGCELQLEVSGEVFVELSVPLFFMFSIPTHKHTNTCY